MRTGSMSQEMAYHHPKKHMITRAVGAEDKVDIDFFDVSLFGDEIILLCSDGLSNMVEDDRIRELLLTEESAQQRAESLVQAANQKGGRDNITVIVVEPFFQRGESMLARGTFIADRYEILDKVGAGGMSDVYKAKDHILDREVAVKVLKAEFAEDVTFVTKFRSEAQSAARLEHPNIVNIYDVGSENGMYYIVMEYVEGITLKTYIEKKGRLNFKEAISIAIQVGRGIEAAHKKNIIHRDIKPQNIIISTEGKVKVTDFGIARAASSNTIHADVMGSVHYASPEQARNGYVDGRSDIYSLGIVMYEMVTGRVPFDGDSTVAVAIQHLQEEMVAPSAYAPDLPISLEKIILKATMKNPDRRYATIEDLLMDLKKALVSPNEDFCDND